MMEFRNIIQKRMSKANRNDERMKFETDCVNSLTISLFFTSNSEGRVSDKVNA